MSKHIKSISIKGKCFAALALLISAYSASAAPDPISQYIINGKAVPNWVAYVGNSLNYFVSLENGKARTERKNLIVTPIKEKGEIKVLNLKWAGKQVKNEWGGNILGDTFFSLGKNIIDISSVEDIAALSFDIKVLRSPNDNVMLSMGCEYSNKCSGKFPIKNILKNLEKDTWQQLPIPLNCFNKDNNFNFTKVTNILSIATQGKLEIQIKNIQLVGLPEGSKGCK
ncbi:putative glycoside hydrolase [Paraglaciecola sp. L3A3]|uniref:putative glycoside hydrolase n=1 Tax=Paraglaciecola sp. L3A3 TaxID=2686358 RepID=UPI00131D3E49|nr:putative glycoside hydrolase [Paraglaciecola sp. L3A3]